MTARRILVPLAMILAVGLRLGAGALSGCSPEIPAIQATYQEAADSMMSGAGYTLSGPSGEHVTPIGYYLPGYAVLLAPIEGLLGPTCVAGQVLNAVVDGTIGTLLASQLFVVFGLPIAGVAAALLYAVLPPQIHMTSVVAPDALASVLMLGPAVAFAAAMRRRALVGALAAGALTALAGAFRGELVALLPGLALVMLVRPGPWRTRSAAIVVLLVGWAVASAPLAVFWQQQYGYAALSRPGIGIRLWAGLSENAVPFEPDFSAAELLARHRLAYGSADGDAFLLSDAIDRISRTPAGYAAQVVERGRRILSAFGGLTALAVATAFLAALRLPTLGILLVVLWSVRAIPFSLMYFLDRDLVPLATLAALGSAYTVELVVARLRGSPVAGAHLTAATPS